MTENGMPVATAFGHRQIGSLIVTNPDRLKDVRTIAWNRRTGVLTAVAVSRLGSNQEYIHFLEPGREESRPCESYKTATTVSDEDCRFFIQAVEAESGQDFPAYPSYRHDNADVLVWTSSAPDPPISGQTPPPVSVRSDSE